MNSYINIAITADLPAPYLKIHLLRYLPGFHLMPHSHTFSHLIVVTKGNLTVYYEGNEYNLHEGHAILLPAKIPHELYSPNGFSQIGIDMTNLEDLPDTSDLRNIGKTISAAFPSGFATSKLLFEPCTFDDIYELVHKFDDFNRLKLINWVDSFVVNFIESNRTQENNDYYQKFIKLISSPTGYTLTLNEMCKKLNLSKTHLERLVNDKFGCSAIEYCKRLKVTKACAFLLDTNLSISDISERLSFNSAAHFSYFFKQRMGVTPSEYRNQSLLISKND